MKPTLIIILCAFCQVYYAQNLVENPSFEKNKRKPSSIGGFDHLVMNWNSPNHSSTDYFIKKKQNCWTP